MLTLSVLRIAAKIQNASAEDNIAKKKELVGTEASNSSVVKGKRTLMHMRETIFLDR